LLLRPIFVGQNGGLIIVIYSTNLFTTVTLRKFVKK